LNDGSVAGPEPVMPDFAGTLIDWQRRQGRQALPWQQLDATARDAYAIWIAEIMLQQTQVAAVIPFYLRFLGRFPDVTTLAGAPLDDVMQHWSGLGYYSRARNVHATARIVVEAHQGRFPDTVEALMALPGIGRSTAAAIAAFAYGRRAAILDGNVKRVLARVFLLEGVPTGGAFTRRAWDVAESLLPAHDIERYTQGLMDLGATVCTPRNPSCLLCPFEKTCGAHREGRETSLPERAKRRAVPERRATLLVVTRGDDVLLERRPPRGIWGGLWSLPEFAGEADRKTLVRRATDEGRIESVATLTGFTHAFTHFVLNADVVRIDVVTSGQVVRDDDTTRWVARGALSGMGLPAPVRTLLASLA
jgi:A/G-specific adenine glycosylase